MKKLAIIQLLAITLTSCQWRSGKSDGSYAAFNVGMREKGVVQTPAGYIADEASGVESFQNLTSFAKTLAYMDALKGVTRSLSHTYESVKNAKTAAGVTNAQTAAGVEKAAIEAETTKALAAPQP